MNRPARTIALSLILAGVLATGAAAQGCRNTGSFAQWLDGFRQEAAASGISRRTIDQALGNMTLDESVIRRDRSQGVFSQDFLTFAGRMVAKYRLQTGAQKIRNNASLFSRIENQFGVPAPVLVAFWGLETDFGANNGDFSTLRSLAALAYDCRRPEKFRPQLLDALRLIDRGDLSVGEMKGAWAGELGQTQFLPSDYLRSAVDYDGDGRRNLIRSSADALASSANLLVHHGWRRGEPWLEEVRVPPGLPWEQADLSIRHSRAQWAQWDVTYAKGGRLPADQLPAALVLPMGRNGPAFLAYPNFDVYLNWNQSLVYATTAAYFATRLAGAPPVGRGTGTVQPLSLQQIKSLQQRLAAAGYDVGKIDGIIGAKTRAAVKDVQQRLGLPADSYPTPELLQRLR